MGQTVFVRVLVFAAGFFWSSHTSSSEETCFDHGAVQFANGCREGKCTLENWKILDKSLRIADIVGSVTGPLARIK